jgi:exonuclease III
MPNAVDDHVRGVRTLINKNIKAALLEWNPVSGRIITARIQTNLRKISIVRCYVPTESAELVEMEAFYSLLRKILPVIKKRYIIIIMGEFNAQIRKQQSINRRHNG